MVDTTFPGISIIIDLLCTINDKDLILKYGLWVLRHDPARGISIFISRKDGLFDHQEILNHVKIAGRKAQKLMMEHLVETQQANDTVFYDLALLYLAEISSLASSCTLKIVASESMTAWHVLKNAKDPLSRQRTIFYQYLSAQQIDACKLLEEAQETIPLFDELYIEQHLLKAKVIDLI